MKLNHREVEMLRALKTIGCKWLARDKNGVLFAYDKKPVKLTTIWDCDLNWYLVKRYINLFNFIKWEDKKPVKIDDFLKGE